MEKYCEFHELAYTVENSLSATLQIHTNYTVDFLHKFSIKKIVSLKIDGASRALSAEVVHMKNITVKGI